MLLVSCARKDTTSEIERREASAPGMRQAWELLMPSEAEYSKLSEDERTKWAYLLYRHITFQNPTNALAHYELGLLLKDKLNQPAMAICAFETYRILRPTADKARKAGELIREALPAAKQQEIQVVYRDFVRAQRIEALITERNRLLSRMDDLTGQLIAMQGAYEAATNSVVSTGEVAPTEFSSSPQGDGLSPSSNLGIALTIPKQESVANRESVASVTEKPSYEVPEGYTLIKIAEQICGIADAWESIFKANKGLLDSKGISLGDQVLPAKLELVIPELPAFPGFRDTQEVGGSQEGHP